MIVKQLYIAFEYVVVRGLQTLLYYYVPALFYIGHQVRRLTWEGGADGTAKGLHARHILEDCLALHAQLLGDWECRAEYTRTLSVALLSWQPVYSELPGC